MNILVATAAFAGDPILEAVKTAIASYVGLAALVVALVGSIKLAAPRWIDGKEPLLGLGFSYFVGILAKLAMPGFYGPNTLESWALHVICLLVVAVGAKGIHDGAINALKKLQGKPPEGGAGG